MTGGDYNLVFERLGPPPPVTDPAILAADRRRVALRAAEHALRQTGDPDTARGLLGELVDALGLRPDDSSPRP